MIPTSDGPTPEQARANRRLGLALGGGVVALVVVFIAVFTRQGLPKDPDVWRAMQAAGSVTPASETASTGTTP